MKKKLRKKTYIRLCGTNDGKNWAVITTQDPKTPFYIDIDNESIFYKRLAITTIKLEKL